MSDDLSLPGESAEESFLASAAYTFNGQPLEAWSYGRAAAAQRCGLLYGLAPDVRDVELCFPVPGKKKMEKRYTYTYSGIFDDIVTVLFLMTLPPEKVSQIRGEKAVAEFHEHALEWAESQRIRPGGGKRYWEAFALFNRVMNDASETDVDITDRDARGKA